MEETMKRVADWFECDGEGYPEEDSIVRLTACEFTKQEAEAFLMVDLPEIAKGISCLSLTYADGERHGRPVKRLDFATGGWSGAEDLIGAMLEIPWIKLLQTKWERGGLFTFEVPSPHSPVE